MTGRDDHLLACVGHLAQARVGVVNALRDVLLELHVHPRRPSLARGVVIWWTETHAWAQATVRQAPSSVESHPTPTTSHPFNPHPFNAAPHLDDDEHHAQQRAEVLVCHAEVERAQAQQRANYGA